MLDWPHIPRMSREEWLATNYWQALHPTLGKFNEFEAAKKAHTLNKSWRQYGIMEFAPGAWIVVSRTKNTSMRP